MEAYSFFQNSNTDYYTANNDFSGIRYAASKQEIVTYHKDTTVRVWYNQQEESYAMHWHNAMEIVMPVENYYEANVNDRHFRIEAGEILIVPPGELHEMIAPASGGGTRFVYLMDIRTLSGLKGFGSIQPLLTAPIYIQPATYPDIYQDVRGILTRISDAYFGRSLYAELTIYSLLLELFVKLGSNYNNTHDLFANTQSHKQEEYIYKFNELLEYIDSHYTENLTLEDMAELVGFSKFHFSRLFKRYTDYTFCDYLCRRRIKAAEELLSQPNLSITEVAMQSGFPSISTFNRLFREQKKCTPSEYRAKNSLRGIKHL